nr:reverse transcriptase domain-containing protein [Tanacetum cinerariifolium]
MTKSEKKTDKIKSKREAWKSPDSSPTKSKPVKVKKASNQQKSKAPTEGYEDAIFVLAITAHNFELKHGLLTLVQNKQFYGHDKEDPHAHIRYFNKITSTLKFPNVPNTSIKLMFFSFSLEGAARIWLEKEPPQSIFIWDDLVSKFINHEAWDGFKDLLRACPHHGFSELHQLDTFYNALNSKDQDSLNSAAGGNFLDKMPRDCLSIIESKSKVCYSRDKPVVAKVSTNASISGVSPDVVELKDMVKALLLDKKGQNQSPAPVKAFEESYVTCGGAHSYCNYPGTDGNVYRDNIQEFVSQASTNRGNNFNQGLVYQPSVFQQPAYQAPAYQAPAPQTQGVSKEDFLAYVKANDAVMKNMQTQGQNMQDQLTNLTDLITKFVNSNTASTSSSGTLPSNTIAIPKSDLKAITTRSVNPTNNGNTKDVQPQAVQSKSPVSTFERVIAPVSAPKPNPKASIPYPSRRNDERNHLGASINLMPFSVWKRLSLPDLSPTCMTLELTDRSISRPVGVAEDVYVKVGELTLRVGKEVITFNLDQTSRYSANYSDMTAKCIDVIDMACEEYSQDVLDFFDTISSGNPTSFYDLIVSVTSLTLTPFGNSDFLLEEELKICEAKTNKSSVDEPPVVELKALPPHLKYAFLEGDDKLPVIIAKDLSVEEKTALLTVLKSHKRAIAWKLSDIKGINPEFCTYKILMEEDFTPAVQHQRRVNPKIHDIIKQEVIKLLDVGLIYPISDGPWVSPVHCVPKKGGFTVVENKDNELIPTRPVTSWSVCIDYRKLNEATRKDHFPLPFIDQMLERLARNQYYCFLDGFSGYFQIPIDPKDQEKTTFTYPYGTFAYHRMPFELCNAPGTFQRCMMAIFHVMIEKTIEVFMDDFSVFGNSFQSCLSHLEKMLKRPMTRLLEKDTPFIFSQECVDAFQTLKRKLTEASILIAPDWDMPFELMCDASDFAIGAVLGQRQNKHFRRCVSGQKAVDILKACHSEPTGGENRASWSDKLDDALWAFRTAYKTPIGCTPYKLVYEKACHLPVELEHKAYWELKHANFDLKTVGDHRKIQINELNELRDQAYENSLI